MLSIRFDDEHEWWAPGGVVERLFLEAVAHRRIAPELEEWRHIADANGGFSLVGEDPAVAQAVRDGLLAEARDQLDRFCQGTLQQDDATYRASLEKLVALLSGVERASIK